MEFSALKIRSAGAASRLVSTIVLGVCLNWADVSTCCAQGSDSVFDQPNNFSTLPDIDGLWELPAASELLPPAVIDMDQALQVWNESQVDARSEGIVLQNELPQPMIAEPWWSVPIKDSIRPDLHALPIDLDTLFALTAAHSGRVQAVAQAPWVSQSQVEQAQAAFDPTLFSDNRFNSTSDPVENSLTTGGPPRLQDNIVGLDSGLRGQNQRGTDYRVGQRFGHKNSNSNFFSPSDQGTARLYGNLTHPLMRGRKIDVNRSLVLTAQFETQAARAEYQDALQKQLFQVADTYWSLYTERASFLQRQKHLARASEIAELLLAREGYDSSSSQVLRARATVANRFADLAQADASIRNLESRLRALINAPELTDNRNAEFLPLQSASLLPFEFAIENEVATALERRPELAELASKLAATNVRLQLARDQSKPTLNLVAEGYVAGLQGQSDIPGAFVDQFSTGRPGYAAGLVYERPVGNRAATAAVRQRQFEIAQLGHLIDEAKENVRAEVETAVRNVQAAKQAALGRQLSVDATNAEVESLKDRWQTLGNDPQLGQLQLNDLLSSQDRLLQEEQNLLQALVQYNLAILEVQRSTGVLVQFAE
ncbi:TolC family protein [Neorhodopirellula pilleata]|uniref:Outer membrane efflux protein n=1 Tax=Neorhodopirellula pilleata TaxID=2714738 RepID=A0A5C6ATA4_9BACT|nr:TolC family protein [Neorhodopirellula pilleata]TWU01374.1 Outer membrane efflux protein [Neorhodopirellula pilleata]